MRKQEADYVVSGGNVFADLGLPNPELRLAGAGVYASGESLHEQKNES